jgi:hypothetical protein
VKESRGAPFSFALSGALKFPDKFPTAHAVGYLQTLLRSYFQAFPRSNPAFPFIFLPSIFLPRSPSGWMRICGRKIDGRKMVE